MKVYELKNAQGLEALTRTERETPQPGYGQVLVKMRAASLNYRDILVAEGNYGPGASDGLVPLSDGAGEVVAVGEGVTRARVGDRVAGIFMQTYLDGGMTREKSRSALGGAIPGVLAEYVAFSEDGVVQIPDYLSYEEAATLPCAAVTAWQALVYVGGVKPGDTILLQGTGGVSLFALQFAKLSGARVIITSSSDEKLERAKTFGADLTINYRTEPDWDKRVLELTHGYGVDNIVEVGGAGTLNRSLNAVRYGGVVTLVGVLSGAAGEIKTGLMLGKNIRVQGIYVGSRLMFESMNAAMAQSAVHPVIDKIFEFREVREAYEYLKTARHFGKVVIRIGD
ncbi:NADPH:quinone oxidoreductase [Capsulimonas corticalis]|uniref:NADPH:quinone oxidoreductase n=1 Tax=Capsulimonas corticalis TaxID=2219043 RepID=A0A402D5S3_9BACT|nr:NAD(P)-dependent alcohol dehydrogenase [Capsulimonas corticalis]BDI29824.1 NADPH:quinone oxidoreductase [Capsulimonas corticalis]